jgi:hypothetical protein
MQKLSLKKTLELVGKSRLVAGSELTLSRKRALTNLMNQDAVTFRRAASEGVCWIISTTS